MEDQNQNKQTKTTNQPHRQTNVHTYIDRHIRTYIRTYIHTYIHTYTRTYINPDRRAHTYMHTYTKACAHTSILAYRETYIHACMRARIHTYIHTWPKPFEVSSNPGTGPFLPSLEVILGTGRSLLAIQVYSSTAPGSARLAISWRTSQSLDLSL